MSVVDTLRENDPSRTQIMLSLNGESSDADLAQALQQNPFITELAVDLSAEQRIGWNSLLHVIKTRDNLVKVSLTDAIFANPAPAALVSAIFRAIQQNAATRTVLLSSLRLPADISTFVDAASSITYFSLCDSDMEPVEQEQGARDLAAALQRNNNIRTLALDFMDDTYVVPILESLQANVSLKKLFVNSVRDFSTVTAQAIQQLLESTTSIQTIELATPSFKVEEFSPGIARHHKQSTVYPN